MSVERSELNVERSAPRGAVFLSYASQDAEAAKRICEALRAAGVEVWFDQSELVGGDQWDGKIRGQISSCALFMPIISANTQARREGYFRIEWKLAAQRTHAMADGTPFLLPLLIDGTRDAEALVPVEFRSVQWTKLAGGETSAAFCQRVQKLLGGEAVGGALRPDASEPSGRKAPPTIKPTPRWLAPVIGGVVVALLAVVISRPWQKAAVSPDAAKPAELAKPPAPMTDAQKLVAQARKIYEDGDELNRDNLSLAEELVQRALALDPAEPSAWEVATWLSCQMVWHSIEDTQARRETLLRQANRAVALAPDSVAAQLVFANAEMVRGFGGASISQGRIGEIEANLQRLAQREPQNWKIQRTLGTFYRLTDRLDEAIRTLQRAIELSSGHPMATADLVNVLIRRSRYADAETLLTGALGRQRSGRLLTFNLIVKCRWRGDVQGAAKDIADWPDWLLQQDRGIAVAWQTALWARQPDLALRLVQQFPRQYVRDMTFSGPRAVLAARAQELAGNTVAAQADWRAVLQQCDQDLAVNASEVTALYWKAWALARLGDQAGAQAAATLLRQRVQTVPNNYIRSYTAAALWATVGWTDAAVSTLQAELQNPTDYISLSRAGLEFEPAFDPIRQDPRFRELMALAPAPQSTAASAPKVDDKSVAVLAFANLSDDKANEYFSDGISEELLNVLGRVPGLRVAAPLSAFSFKGKNVSAQEIGQKLNVAYLVNGSVRRAGPMIRVVARLSRAHTDEQIWTEKFDGEAKDVFALQDEIAGKIAAALSLKLGVSARAAKPIDPEAYRLYLEGRHFWSLRNYDAFDRAETAFKQAVKLEPESALIHAGLAELYATRGWYLALAGRSHQDDFALGTTEAERAVALDPDNAQAYAAPATIALWRRQFPEAERLLRKALALAPNDATIIDRLGDLMVRTGRLDAALEHYQHAAQLDPFSVFIVRDLVRASLWARRYEDCIAIAARYEAAAGQDSLLPIWRSHALIKLGKIGPAAAELRAALPAITGGDAAVAPFRAAEAVQYLREAGCVTESEALAQQLLASVAPDSYLPAMVLAAAGRYDEAIPKLKAFPAGAEDRLYWGSIFDPVREDPGFLRKIEELGVAAEYKVARETLARMLKEQAAKR